MLRIFLTLLNLFLFLQLKKILCDLLTVLCAKLFDLLLRIRTGSFLFFVFQFFTISSHLGVIRIFLTFRISNAFLKLLLMRFFHPLRAFTCRILTEFIRFLPLAAIVLREMITFHKIAGSQIYRPCKNDRVLENDPILLTAFKRSITVGPAERSARVSCLGEDIALMIEIPGLTACNCFKGLICPDIRAIFDIDPVK